MQQGAGSRQQAEVLQLYINVAYSFQGFGKPAAGSSRGLVHHFAPAPKAAWNASYTFFALFQIITCFDNSCLRLQFVIAVIPS